MALSSQDRFQKGPANGIRDVQSDYISAVKKRIAERKGYGLDTMHLEWKLQQLLGLQHDFPAPTPGPDREDDNSDVVGKAQEAEAKRTGGRGHRRRDPLPTQVAEKDDEVPHGDEPSTPPQVSPWPAKEPIRAITPAPQDPNAQAKRARAEAAAKKAAEEQSDKK